MDGGPFQQNFSHIRTIGTLLTAGKSSPRAGLNPWGGGGRLISRSALNPQSLEAPFEYKACNATIVFVVVFFLI